MSTENETPTETSSPSESPAAEPKKRAPREPAKVGVQVWDENESRWDDLEVQDESGVATDFDSVGEAKNFMQNEHGEACKFRIVTIRGPFTLATKTTTTTTII